MKTSAPSWLKNAIALVEWERVCREHYKGEPVPDDVLGPLAIYCGIHGQLATALQSNDFEVVVKLSPLVGQYRTLAAALFGRGSTRVQPGKNPFQALRDARKGRAKPRKRRRAH